MNELRFDILLFALLCVLDPLPAPPQGGGRLPSSAERGFQIINVNLKVIPNEHQRQVIQLSPYKG